jgi:hypothetical protein
MSSHAATREDLTSEFVASSVYLEDLLRRASEEIYQATDPKPGRTSSIGAHVRHCLDHLEALVSGQASGVVCYDRRRREALIERSPRAALSRLLELRDALLRSLIPGAPVRPLRVEALVDESSGRFASVTTSLERELLFVTAHNVHHLALIKILAGEAGLTLPPGFGKALSTRAHELGASRSAA